MTPDLLARIILLSHHELGTVPEVIPAIGLLLEETVRDAVSPYAETESALTIVYCGFDLWTRIYMKSNPSADLDAVVSAFCFKFREFQLNAEVKRSTPSADLSFSGLNHGGLAQ